MRFTRLGFLSLSILSCQTDASSGIPVRIGDTEDMNGLIESAFNDYRRVYDQAARKEPISSHLAKSYSEKLLRARFEHEQFGL